MPAAVARARGYETQAPSLADLAGQALRIHELPLATRPLTPAQAAAASLDPAQAFIRDRGHGAVPWADGEEFAWFVVPRDLLSQPGAPSTAGFGHVCAALPAPVPLHLEVANAFRTSVSGSRQQVLQLRWQWP